MKRIFMIFSTVILILGILSSVIPATLVTADSGNQDMQNGFTVDPGQSGLLVERGATIHHLATGDTEVYGSDGKLKLKVRDSESPTVITPYGLRKSTEIYHLPNMARIEYDAKLTKIYDGDNLILTVIDDRVTLATVIPAQNTNAWLGDTVSPNLTIDYCDGYWGVPNPPPNRNDCAFYFNGIESDDQHTLLQPLLQWNHNTESINVNNSILSQDALCSPFLSWDYGICLSYPFPTSFNCNIGGKFLPKSSITLIGTFIRSIEVPA